MPVLPHGARFEQALRLGVVDHGLGDAVLDGARGVEVFQLGQELRFQALFLFDVGQLQQGSLADQLVGGCINVRHDVVLLFLIESF